MYSQPWSPTPPERRPVLRWLAVSFMLGYAMWLLLFGYHRYLLAWELLAPLLLVAATTTGVGRRLALAIVVVAMLTTNPPNHERAERNWGAGVPLAPVPMALEPDTLIVMTGVEPTSHALPFLQPFAGAVRIESNLHGGARPAAALDQLARSRIAAHAGSVALLLQARDPAGADPVIASVGLARAGGTCAVLQNALVPKGEPPLQLCPLRRLGGGPAGLR